MPAIRKFGRVTVYPRRLDAETHFHLLASLSILSFDVTQEHKRGQVLNSVKRCDWVWTRIVPPALHSQEDAFTFEAQAKTWYALLRCTTPYGHIIASRMKSSKYLPVENGPGKQSPVSHNQDRSDDLDSDFGLFAHNAAGFELNRGCRVRS